MVLLVQHIVTVAVIGRYAMRSIVLQTIRTTTTDRTFLLLRTLSTVVELFAQEMTTLLARFHTMLEDLVVWTFMNGCCYDCGWCNCCG